MRLLVLILTFSILTGCCINPSHRYIRPNYKTLQSESELAKVKSDLNESKNKTSKGLEKSIESSSKIKDKITAFEKDLIIQLEQKTLDEKNIRGKLTEIVDSFELQIHGLNAVYNDYQLSTLKHIESLESLASSLRIENNHLVDELNDIQKDYTQIVIEDHKLREELTEQKKTTNRWRGLLICIITGLAGFVLVYLYVPSAFSFLFNLMFKKGGK